MLLQLSDRQLDELTAVCNRYPDISVATELPEGPDVPAGERQGLGFRGQRGQQPLVVVVAPSLLSGFYQLSLESIPCHVK